MNVSKRKKEKNVNKLNAPIKSQRFPALIIKQDWNIFHLQEIKLWRQRKVESKWIQKDPLGKQ